MKPEGLFLSSIKPAKCPYSEPDQSSPRPLSRFPQHPFSIIATSRPRCSRGPLSGFRTKTLYVPVLSPYAPHALTISFCLIWSPEKYFMKSTDYKAPRYVVFSTPFLTLPFQAQISSSAPFSRTPTSYVPPLCERSSFTPIQKEKQNYSSVYFNLHIFVQQSARQKSCTE